LFFRTFVSSVLKLATFWLLWLYVHMLEANDLLLSARYKYAENYCVQYTSSWKKNWNFSHCLKCIEMIRHHESLSYRSCSIMENERKYFYILSSSLGRWFFTFCILPVWIFISCKRVLYSSFQYCSRFLSSKKTFYLFLSKIFIFSL
jgi:hypothetical protein